MMKQEEVLYRTYTLISTLPKGIGHQGLPPVGGVKAKRQHGVNASCEAPAGRRRDLHLASVAASFSVSCARQWGAYGIIFREKAFPYCYGRGRERPGVRVLADADLLHREEDKGIRERGQAHTELAGGRDSSRVARTLEQLRLLFPGEEAGEDTATMVEALLQLHLSEKDVESMFARNRPLYNSTFVRKTRHVANMATLVDSLLACGLIRKEVGGILRKNPHLLSAKDCLSCAETARYLRDELRVARLAKMLTAWPGLLMAKVGKVREIVCFLREESGAQDPARTVERFPPLLWGNVDSFRERAAALRLLLDVPDVGPLIDKCPQLLYVSASVPAATFRWLVDTLGEEAARKLIFAGPEVLTGKAETHAQKLENLRAMLPPSVDAEALLLRSPSVLDANPESLRRNFAWLCAHFGERDAVRMVQTCPRVASVDAAVLRPKAEFVAHEMGRSRAELAASPRTLFLSLEGTLRPRYAAVQRLGLARRFALNTLFSCSSRSFERRLERWAQAFCGCCGRRARNSSSTPCGTTSSAAGGKSGLDRSQERPPGAAAHLFKGTSSQRGTPVNGEASVLVCMAGRGRALVGRILALQDSQIFDSWLAVATP
eukprot:jgi/Mesen1/9407/ME000614S08667